MLNRLGSFFKSSGADLSSGNSHQSMNGIDCPVQQMLPRQQRRMTAPSAPDRVGYMNARQRNTFTSPTVYEQKSEPWSFADDDAVLESEFSSQCASQPEPEMVSTGSLTVNTRVEYTSLPRGQSRDVFGLVTLEAAARPTPEPDKQAAEKRQPIDIVCVLDVSGSMSGEKIRLVQDAVRFVVDELKPGDRLSLVSFSSVAARCLRLCRMQAQGKDEAHRAILSMRAGGGTSIASGLEAGLAVMEQRRQRNPVSAILLLTDGQDGSSRQRLPGLIERVRASGCSLYAFGFGADHDAALMADVAERAQTPFSFVEDVDSIRSTFAGAVGGLVSVAAQRVELTLTCSYPLKAIHTPFQVDRTAEAALVKIPDMLAGERKDIVVELSLTADDAQNACADAEGHITLLTAAARYLDLVENTTSQTAAVAMRVSLPDSDVAQPEFELEPDAEVSAQRCRVEATQALSLAREHGDAGRYDDARSVLEAGRKKLSRAPKTTLGDAMQLELQAAEERLVDRNTWEDGGRAELHDMCQMNKMQRSSALTQKKKCAVQRSSMSIYTNSVQKSWVAKSSGA